MCRKRVTVGAGGNVALLVLTWLFWAGAPLRPQAADIPRSKPPPGQDLFSDGRVRSFRITVEEPALAALQKDNRAYVRATFTDGSLTLRDVGVHLKGMGSFRPLHEKPSFAVKFDRFAPGQVYTGLSKIMLNNASQDGTYLAEAMATQMFRDAGVPASRVAHAFVEFNGRPLGLYVLVEAMNKDFLKQHFRNSKGNLYEAYLAGRVAKRFLRSIFMRRLHRPAAAHDAYHAIVRKIAPAQRRIV